MTSITTWLQDVRDAMIASQQVSARDVQYVFLRGCRGWRKNFQERKDGLPPFLILLS